MVALTFRSHQMCVLNYWPQSPSRAGSGPGRRGASSSYVHPGVPWWSPSSGKFLHVLGLPSPSSLPLLRFCPLCLKVPPTPEAHSSLRLLSSPFGYLCQLFELAKNVYLSMAGGWGEARILPDRWRVSCHVNKQACHSHQPPGIQEGEQSLPHWPRILRRHMNGMISGSSASRLFPYTDKP